MPEPADRSMEDRIKSLESTQRRLVAVTMMLGVLAVALGAWQFLPVNSTLEGERLILRDSQHRSRAEMLTTADGTVMVRLNNTAGKARSIWQLAPGGAVSLRLTDAEGFNRAEIRRLDSGDPSVELAGPDGRTRAWFGASDHGGPPGLVLRDDKGSVLWAAPTAGH
jgi:hypothetical protein